MIKKVLVEEHCIWDPAWYHGLTKKSSISLSTAEVEDFAVAS